MEHQTEPAPQQLITDSAGYWLFLPSAQKGLIICSSLNLLALTSSCFSISNELGLLSLLVFRQTSVGHFWHSARFRTGSCNVLPVYGLVISRALGLRLQAFVIAIERFAIKTSCSTKCPMSRQVIVTICSNFTPLLPQMPCASRPGPRTGPPARGPGPEPPFSYVKELGRE
jgi:hypothetical protein